MQAPSAVEMLLAPGARAANAALLETILEEAAETAGDLTAEVMAELGRRYPGVGALFDAHRSVVGRADDLEGQMVAQALYCLMEFFANPEVVRIMLQSEVDHHAYLKVPPEAFSALLEATVSTISRHAPQDSPEVGTLLEALSRALVEMSRPL